MQEREPGLQPEEEKEISEENRDLDQVPGVPDEAFENEHQRQAEDERRQES